MRGVSASSLLRHLREPFLKTASLTCRPAAPRFSYTFAEPAFRVFTSADTMTRELHGNEETLKRVLETEEGENRKKPRRKKKESPVSLACYSIFAAAKQNDRQSAMLYFRQARDNGLRLPQGVMNSVLYLLVGGDSWFERAVDGPSPDAAELKACRDEILDYMRQHELLWDEVVYVTQARLSAVLGDPEAAFGFAEQVLERFPPKLRFFTPALIGFAEQGEMQRALHVQQRMDDHELDLTQLEFRLLFKACLSASGGYSHIAALLKRVGKELTFLERDTIEVVRSYFNSVAAKEAFAEGSLAQKQLWMMEDVKVNSEGFSLTAGEKLSASDLEEADWQSFLAAFEELALKKEPTDGPFRDFMSWIDRHGPFNIVLDGANIAFHKQNYDQGAFSFAQISGLVEYLQETFPKAKILVVLHLSRTKSKAAKDRRAQEFLARLQSNKQLFVAPIGSNDDWYWLHAALQAREAGLLVSNDECRDHIFQLLAPKYFLKWKERHLIRYEFQNGNPTIRLPSLYTSCTQQLSNGTWMLPYRDSEEQEMWLCAKPL